jgi:hypothetical protein
MSDNPYFNGDQYLDYLKNKVKDIADSIKESPDGIAGVAAELFKAEGLTFINVEKIWELLKPGAANGAVTNGVVVPSGSFAGGTQTPPIYTAATTTTPGTLSITLANAVVA